MATETMCRNVNMFTGLTYTKNDDDCKKEELNIACNPYSDSDCDSDCDSDSDSGPTYMVIFASDDSSIDADPFLSESDLVYCRYKFFMGSPKVDSTLTTLEVVKGFCEEIAKMKKKKDADGDEIDFKKKLEEYKSKLLKDAGSSFFELIKAAFSLRIKSLIDVMMEEVVSFFKKMEEVEFYNFFFVNLQDYSDIYEDMKDALVENPYDRRSHIFSDESEEVKEFWKSELIRRKFHELKSYDHQRLWLTAHFLLRHTSLAHKLKAKKRMDDELKAKDSALQEGTPPPMANTNDSYIMKRKGGLDDDDELKAKDSVMEEGTPDISDIIMKMLKKRGSIDDDEQVVEIERNIKRKLATSSFDGPPDNNAMEEI